MRMTRYFISTLLAITLMASFSIPQTDTENLPECYIFRYVTCEGAGIEGVAVSDGVEVVRT